MGVKPSAHAGWCLFVLLLFLTAFYLMAGSLLSVPGSWGARIAVMLAEGAAFFGGCLLVRALSGKSRPPRRYYRFPSRVYVSFSLFAAAAAALGVFLLQIGVARVMQESYRGLEAIYPMLVRTADVPFPLVFLTLVLVPALSQELFLRGGLFPVFETDGLPTALVLSTLSLPMLYVHPTATLPLLFVSLVCTLETFYTGSVWPAVFTHLLCRLALLAGTLLLAAGAAELHGKLIIAAAVVLFLLFLFSLLRAQEGLLRDGLLERFERGGGSENLVAFFRTPGFLLFLLLYLLRLVMILSGVWN